ncbi:flagellar FlbD family protein [Blastopirellula marina]|uniref:Flagellar protein n=1 Tax=Blastopirellula marina TaxID=124 RepID=A0A2S8FCN0_9BACT|nr:flagellar FlbD family protein [Blastopirellula marina]PQO29908.1 flagellar protein [Blastopirellula marina]PTL42376.1 flagellar protein [Blastopirellula marina]
MIKLTHLGGEPFVLNAEMIRYLEASPDTFVTLTNGDRIVVREPTDVVVDRVIEYHQRKNLLPPGFSRPDPGAE